MINVALYVSLHFSIQTEKKGKGFSIFLVYLPKTATAHLCIYASTKDKINKPLYKTTVSARCLLGSTLGCLPGLLFGWDIDMIFSRFPRKMSICSLPFQLLSFRLWQFACYDNLPTTLICLLTYTPAIIVNLT